MDISEFIGTWKNQSGNILEINPNKKNSLKLKYYGLETQRLNALTKVI